MSLSANYFNLITSKTDNASRKTYTVYAPKRSTLVLFSAVTQEPLASIMFQAHSENIPRPQYADAPAASFAHTVIYPRTNDAEGRQNFQAVADKDGQHVEYVLTNLCAKGDIDFNLMMTPDPVREVNPGGINQINELHPNQSNKIYCDQTRDNAKMILEAVTRATVDLATGSVTMAPVSVGQDEDEVADKRKSAAEGTRYFLSVVPQTGVPSLRESFAKTFWKAVDMIILERDAPVAPQAPLYRGGAGSRGWASTFGNSIELESGFESRSASRSYRNPDGELQSFRGAITGGDVTFRGAVTGGILQPSYGNPSSGTAFGGSEARPFALGSSDGQLQSYGGGAPAFGFVAPATAATGSYPSSTFGSGLSLANAVTRSYPSSTFGSGPPAAPGSSVSAFGFGQSDSRRGFEGVSDGMVRLSGTLGGGSRGPAVSKSATTKSKTKKVSTPRSRMEDDDDSVEADEWEQQGAAASKKPGASRGAGGSEGAPAPLGSALSRSTQAVRIRAGDRANVSSSDTGNAYMYELASFPCVLGISVSVFKEQVLAPAQWFEYETPVVAAVADRIETAYQAWIASGRHSSRGIFSMEVGNAEQPPTLVAVTFSTVKALPALRNATVVTAFAAASSSSSSSSSVSVAANAPIAMDVEDKGTASSSANDTVAVHRFARRAPTIRVLGGLFMTEAPPQSTLLERANQMLAQVSKKKDAALLAMVPDKFKSDECCVCMEPNPTMLIAICGHICLCSSKACVEPVTKNCPICRGPITAKLLCE